MVKSVGSSDVLTQKFRDLSQALCRENKTGLVTETAGSNTGLQEDANFYP